MDYIGSRFGNAEKTWNAGLCLDSEDSFGQDGSDWEPTNLVSCLGLLVFLGRNGVCYDDLVEFGLPDVLQSFACE